MLLVGLTGGIGSGKSTVAAILSDLGAHILDADAIARALLAPGGAMVEPVVAAFGDEIQAAPGAIDRSKLSEIIFADDEQRTRLNELMHPAVGKETMAQLESADPESIVIVDVPLLVETNQETRYEHIIVVEAPIEVRLTRLVERGMTREDAIARIAVQASDEERRAVATWLIKNDGHLDHLRKHITVVWNELVALNTASRSS
ncbi:MAG: dephospho-CoA kinase [Acidimicrobiia bacterium]